MCNQIQEEIRWKSKVLDLNHPESQFVPAAVIDVEAIGYDHDDDVTVLSRWEYDEAMKNHGKRNPNPLDFLIDDFDSANSADLMQIVSDEQIANSTDQNLVYIDLDSSCSTANVFDFLPPTPPSLLQMRLPPSPTPTPREELEFTCPICMSPFVEATTTRCGHIFCKECIKNSLRGRRAKCPTCRQRITSRGLIRVFLPDNLKYFTPSVHIN